MNHRIKLLLTAYVFAASVAQAAVTTYTTAAAYSAATSGNTVIDFEAQGNGDVVYYGNSLTVGGVSFTDTLGRLFVLGGGFYAEGFTSNYLNENDFSTDMAIGFGSPVQGFAMDAVLLNFTGGSDLTAVFSFAGGTESIMLSDAFVGGSPQFLGFTSDVAFSSVTITNSGGGLALDNFDFAASATPEPGSLVLAGLALAGLAVVGRKRR